MNRINKESTGSCIRVQQNARTTSWGFLQAHQLHTTNHAVSHKSHIQKYKAVLHMRDRNSHCWMLPWSRISPAAMAWANPWLPWRDRMRGRVPCTMRRCGRSSTNIVITNIWAAWFFGGVIELPIICWGIKKCKCMIVLSDLPLIVRCLGC